MRPFLITFFFLLTLRAPLWAQKNWALGLELGHAFHPFDGHPVGNTFNFTAGLRADIPLGGRVFLATGLLRKRLGKFTYRHSTGRSTLAEVDGEMLTVYEFATLDVFLDYWSVPLAIKYRIPGEMLFLRAGLEWDFRDFVGYTPQAEEQTNTYTNLLYEPDLPQEIKEVNATFVFGIGFELHKNEQLRLILRPEYAFIINPGRMENLLINQDLTRLRISLGAQYLLHSLNE